MNSQNQFGIFISGFRWSGSSALSDWLESFPSLRKPLESDAPYGEIRALNYGLNYLLKTAEGLRPFGESLGRYALIPERKLWSEVFGKSLSSERGMSSLPMRLSDQALMSVARFRLNPPLSSYGPLLNTQLGKEFQKDEHHPDI
jgi:hypothetical protein